MWALLNYLTKYVTKPEVASGDFAGIAESVLGQKGPDAKASTVYIKALDRTRNRDYAAQEVCSIC